MTREEDEEILASLEARARQAEADRERLAAEAEEAVEKADREKLAARDALRPSFREAAEEAAPAFQAFLESPEWDRLLRARGRLAGVAKPAELVLPPLYLTGHAYREPFSARAVFEDEVRRANPYLGGVYTWTVGPRLTLAGKWHGMQPARVLFRTEAGLLSLIDWYEKGTHFDGSVPVALRFCRLVTEGQLLRRLANVPR
ncbi:MAG: hypothetical protein U0529_19955 [Thermoanaerobaculia bacterium]